MPIKITASAACDQTDTEFVLGKSFILIDLHSATADQVLIGLLMDYFSGGDQVGNR